MAAWARSAFASIFILHSSAFLLETSDELRSRRVGVGEQERHGPRMGRSKVLFEECGEHAAAAQDCAPGAGVRAQRGKVEA